MSEPSRSQDALQQCIHCGRQIRLHLRQCPYCREAQSERRPARAAGPAPTGEHFRSGLLLILMSTAVHYLAGGYVSVTIPDSIRSLLTLLVPFLFLGGLAMTLRGIFLRLRA